MTQWTPKAFYYDFSRPFPSKQVTALFKKNKLINTLMTTSKNFDIYEPCAGTGRITIPLAIEFPNTHITVSDRSGDMLDVLKHRMICESVRNIEAHVCDVKAFVSKQQFDLIIVCSALHAIEEWETVLDIWVAQLAPTGYLCFIGDESELTNQALGRSSELFDNKDIDKKLALFWGNYRNIRKQMEADNLESSQIGCKWEINNQEPVAKLLASGFTEVASTRTDWEQQFQICDLLKIVEERCYSSMFTTDASKYAEIVHRLQQQTEQMFEKDIMVKSQYCAIARFLQRKSASKG